MSNWPDGTVQTQSGCTVPAGAPLCGDCGNGFRFPPGQARAQRARLTDFCGAVAPQYRRGAPVSRVWGRHSPTSSRPGEQMSGAKFGPRVDTCSYNAASPQDVGTGVAVGCALYSKGIFIASRTGCYELYFEKLCDSIFICCEYNGNQVAWPQIRKSNRLILMCRPTPRIETRHGSVPR